MIYKGIDCHGIHHATEKNGGMCLYRFPDEVTAHFCELGQQVSNNMCGVELRFVPLEDEVRITLSTKNPTSENNALLYFGSVQGGGNAVGCRITHTPTEFVFKPSPRLGQLRQVTERSQMPFAPQVVRLILSLSQVIVHDVKGAVRPPLPEELPAQRGLFYGSSITHGSMASAPNMYWVRRTAEALGCDAENYGLAGSCRFEKEAADWFASRDDWDFMVLEMGINTLDVYNEETYRERVRYMIETLHAAHPDRYLFCIDLFYYQGDLDGNATADAFRRVLGEEVARLHSDKVVHFIGTDLLTGPHGLSEDMVHPSIEGVWEIATNLTNAMRPYLRPGR